MRFRLNWKPPQFRWNCDSSNIDEIHNKLECLVCNFYQENEKFWMNNIFFVDVSKINQFVVPKTNAEAVPEIVWLGDCIYVAYENSPGVHVFSAHEPFPKIKTINITTLRTPFSMVASAERRTLYISDTYERDTDPCIWEIDMANHDTVKSWTIQPEGRPEHLSITPTGELLVVVARLTKFHEGGDDSMDEDHPSDPPSDPSIGSLIGSPIGTLSGSLIGSLNRIAHRITHPIPHRITHRIAHRIPHWIPHRIPYRISHRITYPIPHRITHRIPHRITHRIPHRITHRIPHLISHRITHSIPHRITHRITHRIPHRIPYWIPHRIPIESLIEFISWSKRPILQFRDLCGELVEKTRQPPSPNVSDQLC